MPAIWIRDMADASYHNQSDTRNILGVTGTFMIAALITVALRLYVRSRMLHYIGSDDYVMIAAMVCVRDTNAGVQLTDLDARLWVPQYISASLENHNTDLVNIHRLLPRYRWRSFFIGNTGIPCSLCLESVQ